MRRALVLSGGGCKGAFEVGALEYLINKTGLDFHFFLGSSVGALNASILCQARSHQQLIEQTINLKKFWQEIRGNKSIYQLNFFGIFGNSLYNPIGLRRLIKKHINPHLICNNPSKFVVIPTVAIETGELFYADSRNPNLPTTMLDYILASASIPIFFPPVPINNKHWYDGGLRDVTPLAPAFKEQPDEIIVILTFPINDKWEPVLNEVSFGGVYKSLLRIASIMTSEISANDLQMAKIINQNYRIFHKKRKVPIHIIAPQQPLSGSSIDFNPLVIRENIKLGYEAAKQYYKWNYYDLKSNRN